MSNGLNAVDLVSTMKCPGCKKELRQLDGSNWSLNHLGVFRLACSCGRWVGGRLTVDIYNDNRPGPTDDEKTVKEIAKENEQKTAVDPTIYNQGLRQDARDKAERNRRGLDILKQKSEQHGAQVCTTDGRPPDPDYARLGAAPRPLKPNGQHESYYVLCAEERAKGFCLPVRNSYRHVGIRPQYPLRDLTPEEKEIHKQWGYVKYEEYPKSDTSSVVGRFWTAQDLRSGCNGRTTMRQALAETYARDPSFYSGTMCCHCGMHFPVGESGEFVWDDGSGHRVGGKEDLDALALSKVSRTS